MTHNAHHRHILVRLVTGLLTFYGTLVSIILLLRRPLGEQRAMIGLFNSFAHLLMLPALALLPLSLLLRRRWLALTLLIPAVQFTADYGRRFAPRPAAAANGQQLKVMTFNLHKESKQVERIIGLIQEADADIVAVQELSAAAAECFQAALRERYPHQVLHPQTPPNRGQGVLSRYPISSDEYWYNPHITPESLGHLRVEIQVDGRSLILYNVHPPHPGMAEKGFDTTIRARELDTVLERAARDKGGVLIMGDFNMSDQSDDYRRIAALYGDAFGTVGRGMGFTFPDMRALQALPKYWPLPMPSPPFLRLDYIFHSADFQPLEARVWPHSGGSDHRPLAATLIFQQPSS
jgi:vancomycin resistance protein VanJ